MPKRSPIKRTKPAARRRPAPETRVVVTDQAPLRRMASAECAKVMKRLRQARADWARYESQDLAAYQRWLAATFGSLLTEIREAEAKARELDVIVAEVESLVAFGICRTRREAYQRVINPPPPDHEHEDPFADSGEAEPFDEFDLSETFEDMLRGMLGINPDRLDDETYEEMFEKFKHAFVGGTSAPPGEEERSPPAPEPPVASRLKTLYRTLVRRLHPDVRSSSDAQSTALWHEVQEAYDARDEERLEILSALTDMHEGEVDGQTTIWQLRGVLRELKRALRALQKDMRRVKKDPAWKFSARTDRKEMESAVHRELRQKLEAAKADADFFAAKIARWKGPSKRPSRPPEPVPARAVQDEFCW